MSRAMMMGIGMLAGVAGPLSYVPDLGPVGSKATYFPRSVENDARALNFLGFMSDAALDAGSDTSGNQATDMAQQLGAWDSGFRAAITRFQAAAGLTADSWVGPATRRELAARVTAKNAGLPPLVPPPPGAVIPVAPGGVPGGGVPVPGTTPVASTEDDDTLMYVGIGAGVLVVGGLLVWAFK